MTTLVAGASGATGKQLVQQLFEMGQDVKVIVRSPEKVPEDWKNNPKVSIITAGISEISVDDMAGHLKECHAVACCLGHNLNLRGIYGKPRKLVTGAVRLLSNAIKKNKPKDPVKFVLMNTTGNRNRDLKERMSFGERSVIGLLRLLLPPQLDNEKAADFLRLQIGQYDPGIEWVAVRPDSLINESKVSGYKIYESPLRSPVFNPGKTSRINVGHFMAKLITDNDLWIEWKGKMPVIYNSQ